MGINLYLQNNDNLVPCDQVRIERVAATPFPDRRRIKVEVELTPFREQPNLEIAILHSDGQRAAGTSVIAMMHFKTEFNLHLRGADDPAGDYVVQVTLYYDDLNAPQDTHEAALHIAPASSESEKDRS
jgi:hypothetical protein